MAKKLKVFTNDNFVGFYPVGTAAVVVAESKEEASKLLAAKLASIGLATEENYWRNLNEDMVEIDLDDERVYVLNDGNY